MSRNQFLMEKTVHELGHAIEITEQYNDIRNALLNELTNNEINELVENKINQYNRAGVPLDEEGALKEITSEKLREALIDPIKVNRILNNDADLGRTLLDKIKSVLWNIRKIFGNKNNQAYKQYKAAQELEQMYRNVYDAVRSIDKARQQQAASVEENRSVFLAEVFLQCLWFVLILIIFIIFYGIL